MHLILPSGMLYFLTVSSSCLKPTVKYFCFDVILCEMIDHVNAFA